MRMSWHRILQEQSPSPRHRMPGALQQSPSRFSPTRRLSGSVQGNGYSPVLLALWVTLVAGCIGVVVVLLMPNYYSVSTQKAVLLFKVLESRGQPQESQTAVNSGADSKAETGSTKLTPLDVEAGLAAARAWLAGNVDGAQRKLMTAAALEQLARLQQEAFCRDGYPLGSDGTTVVQPLDMPGVRMHVYANEDAVSVSLRAGIAWEKNDTSELLWALQAPLPPGEQPTSTFVDIGANVGAFTFMAASHGYDVVSFEGMHSNQQLIRSTLCASDPSVAGRVTLHAFGLGREPSSCYIFSDEQNQGDGITLCSAASEEDASRQVRSGYQLRGRMRLETLDNVLQRNVKAMKIDVEGFEAHVLAGASELLRSHTVWFLLVEFNAVMLRSAAAQAPAMGLNGTQSTTAFVEELHRLGYAISTEGFSGPFINLTQITHLADPDQPINRNLYIVHGKMVGHLPQRQPPPPSQPPSLPPPASPPPPPPRPRAPVQKLKKRLSPDLARLVNAVGTRRHARLAAPHAR